MTLLVRIQKRIKKEMILSNFIDDNFSITYNTNNIIIISKNYKFKLQEYPFKPPIFFINDINYMEFIIPKNINLRYILTNYFYCLHCDTIMNKWSPTNILTDLIDEFKLNRLIYKKSYLIYILENSINHKLDKYLLLDIISYIYPD